jgi:predicted nucleic acid-binding protein
MIKVLIDSDVILDLLLDREPFADQSEQIFESLAVSRIQGYATTAAVLNIYYIACKTLGRNAAVDCVRRLLETDGLEIFAVEKQHIQTAISSEMSDFEDAVQASAAAAAEIDFIVTRNKRDYRQSPVPAVLPEELLEKLI